MVSTNELFRTRSSVLCFVQTSHLLPRSGAMEAFSNVTVNDEKQIPGKIML